MESPFAALRLRTDAAKRFKRVDRAIAVIWKMLLGGGEQVPEAEGAGTDEGRLPGCLSTRTESSLNRHQRRLPPDQRLHTYLT